MDSFDIHTIGLSTTTTTMARKRNFEEIDSLEKSYFDGGVSDGKIKLRIRLEDCQIKRGRREPKMEIQLKDTTIFVKSAKTFDFSAIDFDTDAGIAINLGELEDMSLYQKVTADVNIDEPVAFSSGVIEQGVTVANCHAVGIQRLDKYTEQVIAKKPSGNTLALHAFGEIVKKLADVSDAVSESDLMLAPPCQVKYNSARVVVGVSR